MNEIAELYANADKPKSNTKEYFQEYYKKNRDKILQHSGLYYHTIVRKKKNPNAEDKMRNIPLTPKQEYNREYYQKNKKQIQEKNIQNYHLRKQKENQN
jgi:hypothetical protein